MLAPTLRLADENGPPRGVGEGSEGNNLPAPPLALETVYVAGLGVVFVPSVSHDAILAAGGDEFTLRIGERRQRWLTMSEAIDQHLDAVGDIGRNAARARILRAIDAGAIDVQGTGRARRIAADPFGRWLNEERERQLDREDGR